MAVVDLTFGADISALKKATDDAGKAVSTALTVPTKAATSAFQELQSIGETAFKVLETDAKKLESAFASLFTESNNLSSSILKIAGAAVGGGVLAGFVLALAKAGEEMANIA